MINSLTFEPLLCEFGKIGEADDCDNNADRVCGRLFLCTYHADQFDEKLEDARHEAACARRDELRELESDRREDEAMDEARGA